MELSPAPWNYENKSRCSEQFGYAVVRDANGKIVCDTLNSNVAVIQTDHETDGVYYSDAQGRVDLGFVALARNAFDVMMRRGWCAIPWEGGWTVWAKEFDNADWREGRVGVQVRSDPFTALVEADKWYKANVEKTP